MSFTLLVEDLRSTTNRSEKEDFLEMYDTPFSRYLFQETFDPNLLHNVTLSKKSIPDTFGSASMEDMEKFIRNMFDYLRDSQSSKQNKEVVIEILKQLMPDDQEVLVSIINKKLNCGVSIRTLNKVWPNLILVEPIQLANKYSPLKKYNQKWWFYSDKLDGVRIFCFRINGEWKIYSRGKDYLGRELFTLDHWKFWLERFYQDSGYDYLEGEAYKHGWDFSTIQSLVFSTVNLKEKAQELEFHTWLVGCCSNQLKCGKNLVKLKVPTGSYTFNYNLLKAVKQLPVEDEVSEIMNKLDEALARGVEGIVLRDSHKLHSPKRDDHLLKVKPMYFDGLVDKTDCVIVAVEFDDFTIQENGVITTEHLPVRLIVEQPDGIECGVGSGFKLPFRRWLAKHHEEVVAKTAEIEHSGYGSNGRMRFPVYRRIREDV